MSHLGKKNPRVCSPQAPERSARGSRVDWLSDLFFKHFHDDNFWYFQFHPPEMFCIYSWLFMHIFLNTKPCELDLIVCFKQLLTFHWSFFKKYMNIDPEKKYYSNLKRVFSTKMNTNRNFCQLQENCTHDWTLCNSNVEADLFFPVGVVAKSRTRSDSFICISSKQSKGIYLLPTGGGGAIRPVNLYKQIILVSFVSHDCRPNVKYTLIFLHCAKLWLWSLWHIAF